MDSRKASPSSGARVSVSERVMLVLFTLMVAGCDIVQGFQSAGDTLFPEEATHLSTPGVRVVAGGYRDLRFATGGELFLLARSPDDDFVDLHTMRYSNPKPCTIRNVGRFSTTQDPSRRAALIAYLEGDARAGTLRFADTTCNSYDMQLEDATLPLLEIPRGFVVRSGTDLRLVDPQAGINELITEQAELVIRDAFASRHLVRSSGKFKIFDHDWAHQGTFGENVGGFGRIRQSLVFENGRDLSRLAVSATDTNRVEEFTIEKDACALAIRTDTWATYRSPCESSNVRAYNERTHKTFALDFEADSYNVILQPAKDSPGDDPNKDPFWFFILRDVDATTGFGTLIVHTPDRRELELGKKAALPNTVVVEDGPETYGYALVDVDPATNTGTLLWWSPDGRTRELAYRVRKDGRRKVIDYDGVSGNLAVVSGDRVSVVAERVPGDRFEFQDDDRRWTALFNDFDGSSAKLVVFDGVLDTLQDTPLDRPIPRVTLEDVSDRVPFIGPALLDHVLPGIAYYADYDEEHRTGTLVYRNLELKFTARLNYGISDFVVAEDEVIYSIPYGESAGVWVVQGK